MHLPISAKTLFRLHRKLFMIRAPRRAFRSDYSLSLVPDGKEPLLCFRVEKNRPPVLGITLAAAAVMIAAFLIPRKK